MRCPFPFLYHYCPSVSLSPTPCLCACFAQINENLLSLTRVQAVLTLMNFILSNPHLQLEDYVRA